MKFLRDEVLYKSVMTHGMDSAESGQRIPSMFEMRKVPVCLPETTPGHRSSGNAIKIASGCGNGRHVHVIRFYGVVFLLNLSVH